MNTPATAPGPDTALRRAMKVLAKALKWGFYLVGGLIGLILFATAFGSWTVEIVWYLAFGWIHFIVGNLAGMEWNQVLLAEGIACTIALGIGSHYFCRWLYCEACPDTGRAWRWQWTASGLAMVLLLFVAGIGTIGVSHQAAWLFNAKEPLLASSWGARSRASEAILAASGARNDVNKYYESKGRLPQSGEEAGYSRDATIGSRLVSNIEIREKGVIVLTLKQDSDWPDGGEITFTPAEDATAKTLGWKCRSTLPPKFLPALCRE